MQYLNTIKIIANILATKLMGTVNKLTKQHDVKTISLLISMVSFFVLVILFDFLVSLDGTVYLYV